MTTESAQYLGTLHKQINAYFNFSEVKTLCFNLGVDHENIAGETRSVFIRNLIVSMAKRNRLQELVDSVRAERPRADWKNVPTNFKLPDSVAQEDIRQVTNHIYYGDVDQSTTINQQGQVIKGNQVNVGGNANIGQIGDIVYGSANIQRAADKLNDYLKIASDSDKDAANELEASVNIVLAVAAKQPLDAVHLKLLCLGQGQLARKLANDVPGIEQVVAGFITAVTKLS